MYNEWVPKISHVRYPCTIHLWERKQLKDEERGKTYWEETPLKRQRWLWKLLCIYVLDSQEISQRCKLLLSEGFNEDVCVCEDLVKWMHQWEASSYKMSLVLYYKSIHCHVFLVYPLAWIGRKINIISCVVLNEGIIFCIHRNFPIILISSNIRILNSEWTWK